MLVHLVCLLAITVPLATLSQKLAMTSKGGLRKLSIFLYCVLIGVLVIYAGGRVTDRLDTDEWRYRLAVALSQKVGFFSYLAQNKIELLFQTFKWICGNWFHSSQMFLIITSLITQGLIVSFFRKASTNFALAIFIYICSGIYFISFIPINQYLAIALSTYGLLFVEENFSWKYFAMVLLATLFHSAAILLFFMPVLWQWRLTFWKVAAICIGAFVLGKSYSVFFPFLANTQYAIYQTAEKFFYGVNYWRISFWVGQYLLVMGYYFFIKKDFSQKENILLWCACLSMAFYIASSQYVILARVELFFGIAGIALVSSMSDLLGKKGKGLVYLIIGIIYSIYGYHVALHSAQYYSIFTENYLWLF